MSAQAFKDTCITRKEAKTVFKNFKHRSYDHLSGVNSIIARVAQKYQFTNVTLEDIEAARKLIKPQGGSTRYNQGSRSPKYEVAAADGKTPVIKSANTASNSVVNLYMPKSIGNKTAAFDLAVGTGLSALFAGSTVLVTMNSYNHPMMEYARYIDIPFTDASIVVPPVIVNSILNVGTLFAGLGTAGKIFIHAVKQFRNRQDKAHEISVALEGAIQDALKLVMANKIHTATIKVSGISDERDLTKITEAMNNVKGAKVLTIDRPKNLLVVQYNFTSVLEDAKTAVKNMGYGIEG